MDEAVTISATSGAADHRRKTTSRSSVTEALFRGHVAWLTRCVTGLLALGLCAADARAQDGTTEPGSAPKSAESGEEPVEEAPEEPSRYRNPQGSIQVTGAIGVSVGSEQTLVAIGAGVGYAVVTGVVPGIRGVIIAGDGIGAELAGTLTLTPPLATYLVPFLVGEAGRRFDEFGGAWLYGGGGGLYVGEPASGLGLQVGWMFRRLVYEDVTLDASGPIISISISF